MKILNGTASVLGFAAFLLTCNAVAQPPEREDRPDGERRSRERGGPPPYEMMLRLSPVLKVLDADGDGQLSSKEIDNAIVALRTLDKDDDGNLSKEEMRPDRATMRGGARRGPGGRDRSEDFVNGLFERQDADGDGELSGDEIPERMSQRIKQLDTDGDGAISKEEMKAIGNRIRGNGGGAPGDDARPGGEKPRRPPSE